MTLRLDVSAHLPDFLARGADSVVRGFPSEPPFAPDEAMLRQELYAVIEDVRAVMAGHRPGPSDSAPLDRVDLLRRLRRAVLDAWDDDDGSLLEVVRAFETTERALMPREGVPTGNSVGPFSRSLLREVGHLLRSPLGSVVMLTGTLLEERAGPLTAEQRRQVEIVYRAAVSAAASAGDLLTLTSPEAYVEDARAFSVAETVASVADLVRPVTEARHSELVVHQTVEGRRRGPVVAVRQALLGMAVRAALMTPEGAVEVAASAASGDVVVFMVTATAGADSSPGDAFADPLRLFRLDPGSEAYTIAPEGLALHAVRGIVRALGSELEVDGTAGESLILRYRLGLPIV